MRCRLPPDYGVPPFAPLENSAAPSIVYSIARQESALEPTAVSSAGAKGLMQMILSTAKRTAERARVPFDQKRLLTDAAFNAQLAARHLGELLAEQKGSYILAFAAYNAGGKHVKEWLDAYGDPRKPGVDAVDWVERILHRNPQLRPTVIENLAIYQVAFRRERAASTEALLKAESEALKRPQTQKRTARAPPLIISGLHLRHYERSVCQGEGVLTGHHGGFPMKEIFSLIG